MTLKRGLYDQIVTEDLARKLRELPHGSAAVDDLAADQAPSLLLDLVNHTLSRIMDDIDAKGNEALAEQLALVNSLLIQLRQRVEGDVGPPSQVVNPAQRLRAVAVGGGGGGGMKLPATGLASPWLFTAAKSSPSLLNELLIEASECDQIDILVSFITVSGVRKMLPLLQRVTAGDATGAGRTRIRVLTTTYIGATELEALKQLAALNGCTVKISLDGRRTRLHAKAWIFHRQTGFGSAYVGSANLSGAALLGGLEWTVKFTERSQAELYARAQAHFNTLWEDDEFQVFDPQSEVVLNSVRAALARERGGTDRDVRTYFDIAAKKYQQDILEQLSLEREHGRNRNLLVAATGTGKTVMAALDYQRTVRLSGGSRPRLLYVAHRGEILMQALDTYRNVLRDHSFGALLGGGSDPDQYDHLFATIQSVTSRGLVDRYGPEYWHTVVIDECHRMAAPQFDAFASGVRPAILLGLTATPERTDGQPLRHFTLRPDGSPAAELRLWHALDMQLLSPFEYFGCNDDTDFSDVPWGHKAAEAAAIDKVVTGNQIRAMRVVHEWHRLSGNAAGTRALIFCVSVAHAQFMQDCFSRAGLPTLCLTGDSSPEDRRRAPQALREGKICGIVTVDLYNEGVDLPEVDTLLFLRPTQSALLFQQQLGRGLRLMTGKDSCLVLDFVGQHRVDFRFDKLLSSITGLNRRELLHSVEHGFSALPSGCHIHLESQARERILSSLRAVAGQNWRWLKTEVRAYAALPGVGTPRLADFLRDQQVALEEVYRESKPSGWTTLRREAGVLPPRNDGEEEAALSRSLRYVIHVNDPAQLKVMRRVAEGGAAYTPRSATEELRAQMLTYQLSPGGVRGYADFAKTLGNEVECLSELAELTTILQARSRVSEKPIPGIEDLPLTLHAQYESREILTAVGWHTAAQRTPFQAGVLPLLARKLELLFVTLDKSAGYHDRIAYHDYAVSPSRFHWRTQNSAGPDTKAGERYLRSGDNGWSFQLFVRSNRNSAYVACGPVRIASAEDISGDRPMNIFWTLDVALPIGLFRQFSVLRGGE